MDAQHRPEEPIADASNPRQMSRRTVLLGAAKIGTGGLLAALLAGKASGWTLAQTPSSSPLAALGLPELKLTATETGFAGAPSQLAAGRYLVSLTVNAKEPVSAAFLGLPSSLTFQAFVAMLQQAQATPPPGAATAATDQEGGPPPWYYQTLMPGGVAAAPGQTVQTILDLKPGSYAIWGDDPSAPQRPNALTVTGTMPADLAEPKAAVTIQEINTAHGFAFQLGGTLKAGSQVVKVVNYSDQPHEVTIFTSPVPLSAAQAAQLMMLDPSSTPPPGLPNLSQVQMVIDAVTQSAGTTTWHVFDLRPGNYILSCFVPDKNTGMPHVMEGMVDVVTIK